MAKQRVKRPSSSAIRPIRPPDPVLRAWHVVTANGADATVTAHECSNYDGVLAFSKQVEGTDYESVLVRAFSPATWRDVELVETPPPTDGASPSD